MLVKINGEVIKQKEINSKVLIRDKRLDWRYSRVFGIVAPTLSTLLHFSPEMKLAYIVVCGVGVSLVGIGLIENMFISSGNIRTAEIIERVTKSILLTGASIGIGWFIFNAPQWRW
jgi:hypothetical protein